MRHATTHSLPMTGTMSRRSVLAGMGTGAALLTSGLALTNARAQGTPVPASPAGQHLLVADPAARTIYFYSIPDRTLTGQLDDISLDVHGGTLSLADGRVLIVDDVNEEALAVVLDDAGVPTVAQRVTVELGVGASWTSIDPAGRYFVVTSYIEDTPTQVLNLIDLDTFEAQQIEFETNGEELTAWLSDQDIMYVSTGGQIDAYALEDLVSGEQNPRASVPVELGSHGAVVDLTGQQLFLSTAPGFEVLDIAAGSAAYLDLIPWDVDGLMGGQNYRPRLTWDGASILGMVAPESETPEAWADTPASVHTTRVGELGAQRLEVGTGKFTGRWGIGQQNALFAGYNEAGGNAYLIGADAGSDTLGTVLATIPIPTPSKAAVAGQDPDGSEGYWTAITPDDRYGFVVQGGDGVVTVIDVAAREVAEQIDVPTSLDRAGYITVVTSGLEPVDLFGR